MPVITDIKRQKSKEARFNIYLDGIYAFALSDLDLSTSGLRTGQSLSSEEVAEYQTQAERSKAYAWAVRFLAIRPRSRREVEDYLRRKGAKDSEAGDALSRLEGVGLLNDEEFARSWIANRQLLRPRSRRMLERELASKGVARPAIEAALSEVDSEDELQSLMQVIERKQRLPQYREVEKLIAYLGRQGYRYELIKKALARLNV
ncbi:MAG: recX [Patescibacteria group bacterium]|jgi:regulatory protein|nr:recX [Patescibacteria group bacterium]